MTYSKFSMLLATHDYNLLYMHIYILHCDLLSKYRVLGSLVNSEEFSTAFSCSRGSKMYPNDDRCELW